MIKLFYMLNMFKYYIVLLTIIHYVNCNFTLEIEMNRIIECSINLNSSSNQKTLVAYYNNSSTEVEDAIKSLHQFDLQIINMSKNIKNMTSIPYKFALHYLIIRTINEFEDFMLKVYGTAIWNAHSRYLVSYLNPDTNAEHIKQLLTLAWERYVINIVIIALVEDEILYVTYFPYANGSCGSVEPEVLGKCSHNNNMCDDVFPQKIPLNLQGCPIRALINIYPPFTIDPLFMSDNAKLAGLEVNILNALLERTNMSRTTIQARGAFTSRKLNGSYDGSVNYLYQNVCDVALGCFFPNVSFFIDVDVSFFYYYIQFSWIVPAAHLGKQWESLVHAFNQILWFTILGVVLFNTALWWTFGRATTDKKGFKELSMCFLKCWYTLLQGGIDLPVSLTMRSLVLFWTLFSLLLATLYQSQLCSILLTAVYEHQIANPRELVDSSVRIILKNDFFVRLNNSNKQVDREIVQKAIVVSQQEHVQIAKTYQPNSAFLANTATTLYLIPRNYSFANGKPAMYICKDIEFGNPIAMWFRKGYPLLLRFHDLILRFASVGLLEKWVKEAASALPKSPESAEPQKLQVNHMLGVFFVLLFGYIGATLIFITEILLKKYCTKSRIT